MTVDTLRKNLTVYLTFAALSVLVAVLNEAHHQIELGWVSWLSLLDAAIVALIPTVLNMSLNMKLPSVGHEPMAEKVAEHEDRLEVTDAAPGAPGRG